MLTITPVDVTQSDVCSWWHDACVQQGSQSSFFRTPAWVIPWWVHIGSRDPRREARYLEVRRGDTRVALAPLFIQHRPSPAISAFRTLHWMGQDLSPDPGLVETGEEKTESVVHALRHDALHQVGALSFELWDNRNPEPWMTLPRARMTSTLPHLVIDATETNANSGSKRLQRSIRKATAWMEQEDVHWEFRQGPDPVLLEALIKFSRIRFEDASFFSATFHRSFLEDVIARDPQSIRWSVLWSRDQRPLHVYLFFAWGDRLSYFLGSGTRDGQSPGLILLYLTWITMTQHGFRTLDLLRGDEEYKRQFQPRVQPAWDLCIPVRSPVRRTILEGWHRLRRKR